MAESAIWVKVYPSTPSGGVGEWAKVTGGTVTTVNNPDGSVDEVHTFTANGTLTVESPGYARVLCVGTGGGSFSANYGNGGGGAVLEGIYTLPAGTLPVTIGAGVAAANGGDTSLGTILVANGGKGGIRANETARAGQGGSSAEGGIGYASWGGGAGGKPNAWSGVTSSISGTAVEYGKGGNNNPGTTGPQTPGQGANTGANGDLGYPGIVIVRVQKSAPITSGGATGGTVTEYTGDGTNGVLGQKYRVHTFTASGTLTVTGSLLKARCLLVGGGGGAQGTGGGGGGGMVEADLYLPVGANTITVGSGGIAGPNGNGGDSIVGPLRAYGGGTGDKAGGSAGGRQNAGAPIAGLTGQGNAGGGSSEDYRGGGGGGAGAAGGAGGSGVGGAGGNGKASLISGASVIYAGGGGGGSHVGGGGVGGTGGGGHGATYDGREVTPGTDGLGGGGGGGGASGPGAANGGSGVVIIRYEIA